MLITRCPHCQTSFRIRPEQLNLRGGRVRCGHCQTPFSALSSLDEMPEEAAAARIQSSAAPGSASPAAPSAEAQPAGTTASEDLDLDINLDLEQEAREMAEAEQHEDDAHDYPQIEHINLSAVIDEAEHAEDEASGHPLQEALPDAAEQGDEPDNEGGDSQTVPQLHTVFLDDELPHHIKLDAAELALRKAARRRLLVANAALAITGVLLATYVLRTQLTSWYPALRGPLEQVCATLGCDVPYLRDAELVKLEGSELIPSPERRDGYRLAFTVRNEAHYPVAWPQLEIILTDRYERWLTRRILEPAEWLPADSATTPALSAHGELTTRLDLASDVEAVGYKVGVFYR